MRLFPTSALLAGLALTAGAAGVARAADMPLPQADKPEWVAEDNYMLAQVEGVYLRSGCPRDKDCLPPRILPVPSGRAVDLVTVAVPIDPRVNDRPR